MNNVITTKHNLDFKSKKSDISIFDCQEFRVGTCEGLYGFTDDCYWILAIANDEPNNGHLEDVFQWFDYSCKRDKKNLIILSISNKNFGKHLTTKRGFIPLDKCCNNAIKIFNHRKYKQFLITGNEVVNKLEIFISKPNKK